MLALAMGTYKKNHQRPILNGLFPLALRVVAKVINIRIRLLSYFTHPVSTANWSQVRGIVPLNFMGSDALCCDDALCCEAVGEMLFVVVVVADGVMVEATGSIVELLVTVAFARTDVDSVQMRFQAG